MASDIPRRWSTTAARMSLARRFGLPYEHSMQDWEWEVADASRFGEFLDAYSSGALDEDERYSLMEMLIQCVEDMDLPSVGVAPQWQSLAALLTANPWLHAGSVRYWSCLDNRDLEGCFSVSGPMHDIWEVIRQTWDSVGGVADR